MDVLGFAGGNLSRITRDTLARRGYLFPVYGSTKNGLSLIMRITDTSAVDTYGYS